ncbi:MAG: hypothetical protein E6Q97_36915 [Desulfurellales bacterium]|nr:MAG: hypothetical protein E6Q97_36915 [Desulfurellales bacterium]
MSVAKYNPLLVTVQWGPFKLVGFETGEFITAEMTSQDRYTFKSAFGRSIHTQITDMSGMVTMRFQADSPSLFVINTQLKLDLAPGGNIVFPLIVKDNNGLDVCTSPYARVMNIPPMSHNDGDQAPREFRWRCDPLDIVHGGIFSQN